MEFTKVSDEPESLAKLAGFGFLSFEQTKRCLDVAFSFSSYIVY